MADWTYRALRHPDPDAPKIVDRSIAAGEDAALSNRLNQAAEEGWELVGVAGHPDGWLSLVLRRPAGAGAQPWAER